jgi:LPS-assembly lipoprotein
MTLSLSAAAARAGLRRLALFALLAGCVLLAACGFRLKGATPLPIDTLYTNIAENSSFGVAVRRAIRAASPNTRFVSDPREAQARLMQLAHNELLRELSIDAQGRVEEYELTLEFVFQLVDSAGHVILPPTSLRATRELPYDDSVVQAKQSEISVVFQQMQQSMVDRLVRHLTAPDVIAAFNNAANLPVEAEPVDPAPVYDDRAPAGTPAWGAPSLNPDAGMR